MHHLTSPLRKAAVAVDDPELINLWAGTVTATRRPSRPSAFSPGSPKSSDRNVGGEVYAGAVREEGVQEVGPEDRYADLVGEMAGIEGVDPPGGGRGFGRTALRFHGRIFVMFVRGGLVLKLPAARVEELVAAGEGEHFDANKGTPMKEWLSLDPRSGHDWSPLAHEALDFARSIR